MDCFFIKLFWCFQAELAHCSRVWGLLMLIHLSDSHVASPQAHVNERRVAASFISMSMRHPMPTPEHAMAPHASKPDMSVCSLCLFLPHIVCFTSTPCLSAPSSSTDHRFSKRSTLRSLSSSYKYTSSYAASHSTCIAHCPSSVGLVFGVSSSVRMDVHIFDSDFLLTDK
jgi:hypothetical protein